MRFNVSFFYRGHKEKAECVEETEKKYHIKVQTQIRRK